MKPSDIVIDSEFEKLIRPLSNDERKELKESLSSCGLLMPLVIWNHEGKTILVDGHNRLSLWNEFDGFDGDFEFKTQELHFGNRDNAKEWIIKNQLGRRNLSPDDFRSLLGMLYNARKKEAHRPEKRGQSEPVNPQRTAEAIATEFGVSPSTVKRAGKQEEERRNGPIIQAAKAEAKANKPAPEFVEMAQIVTVDGKITEIKKPQATRFNRTNGSVSWAKWTWNPVTGCEHGCKFCYAREIANSQRMAEFYPFKFAPSFHEYRLEAPKNTPCKQSDDPTEGRVFVCSMADLFGKWVPDKWISDVFNACAETPCWEYLFLTKWPKRYSMLATLPKAWLGASIIKQGDVERVTRDMTAFDVHAGITRWVSLEPMLEPITFGDLSWCDLMVIGSQTSTTQPEGYVPAFAPKFEWVADVVQQCREQGIPYYLKPNLVTEPGMQMPQMEPKRRS
jgi:protein gp37